MHEPPYRVKNMMPGMIMLWHGAVGNIPSGWHLCDGTVGTPNLLNKFVPCAGDTYNPGDAGGNINHEHDVAGYGHDHEIPSGNMIESGNVAHNYTTEEFILGATSQEDGRPPYYALCYIMKL